MGVVRGGEERRGRRGQGTWGQSCSPPKLKAGCATAQQTALLLLISYLHTRHRA